MVPTRKDPHVEACVKVPTNFCSGVVERTSSVANLVLLGEGSSPSGVFSFLLFLYSLQATARGAPNRYLLCMQCPPINKKPTSAIVGL